MTAELRTVKVRCTRGNARGCPNWCGYYPHTVKVSVRWECPRCGGPRGEPKPSPYYSDGMTFDAEQWTNACGHADLYNDVLAEAEALQQEAAHAG